MGLTSSLYSSLSGMAANSEMLSVTGNNLANVDTTGFKDVRADFQTQISQTLNGGSAPTSVLGGTNPEQIGLGTELAGTSSNFTTGPLQATGVDTNMALNGNGFFIINSGAGTQYTRDGTFQLDANQDLVTTNGATVQGYGVDSNFNIVPGALKDINIPVGNLTIAQPTQNLEISGNLNASGTVASTRATTSGQELYSNAAHTIAATSTTALTSLYNSSGVQVFPTGSVLTLSGATVGTTTVPQTTFQVGATNTTGSSANGTTYGDLASFMSNSLGINTTVSGDPAGVAISNGQLVVTGNDGTVNQIALTGNDLTVTSGSNAATQPLTFTTAGTNNGESTTTSVVAYDSLGNAMNVNVSLVLESQTSTGSTWRYYAQSTDNTNLNPDVGTGTISFGTNGELLPGSANQITIQRANTGADPTQTINLQFQGSGGVGGVSAFANTTSQIAGTTLDGSSYGTLQSFTVGTDGTITGVFSNSQTRTLGQVAVANFANPEGLAATGDNSYTASASSGSAAVVTAGTGGTGTITGGSIEQSNVDITTEFINLINASTGFSANSKVITTADQMVQYLLTYLQ